MVKPPMVSTGGCGRAAAPRGGEPSALPGRSLGVRGDAEGCWALPAAHWGEDTALCSALGRQDEATLRVRNICRTKSVLGTAVSVALVVVGLLTPRGTALSGLVFPTAQRHKCQGSAAKSSAPSPPGRTLLVSGFPPGPHGSCTS